MRLRHAAVFPILGLLTFTLVPVASPQGGAGDKVAQPLPAAFDLRFLEAATPVKLQLGGTCWTHGTMAAVESHLLLSGYWRGSGRQGLPALSEYHLDWWNGFNKHCNADLADPEKDPTGMRVHQGGDYRVATAYFARGDGIVLLPSGHDVYRDSNWYQKPPPKFDAAYQRLYVRDVEWFTMGDNLEGIDVIKRRIMTEGAIGTCYAAGRTYMASDHVHYQPLSTRGDPNHAVAIIGWDDTKITKDADKKAPKPGAWLIKNSWGTRRVEEGYNWISYYDKHCCRNPEMGAVSFRNIEPMVYTDIYGHDYHGWRDTLPNVAKAFNAYTATGRQMLRAVSFYTTKHDVKYTFKVYQRFEKGQLQGELAAKSGHVPFTGFHTVNLDVPVLLTRGQNFFVAVELSVGGHAIDRTSQIPVLLGQDKTQPPPKDQPAKDQPPKKDQPMRKGQPGKGSGTPWVISKAGPGESFYFDGKVWKDLQEYKFDNERFSKTANFCIKALAVSVEEPPFSRAPAVIAGLSARNIGPANMGGRIVDLAVVESDPKTMYVAAATGGLWKTTDGGTTWAPLFDQQDTLCLGAVAVAPSNPNIVYVGTGEANPRNSVSWGSGVYRSGDGGKTWNNMGLRETSQIGRVVVHPKDPNVVYVAAMGRFWGPNKERGLYKTTNGGKTWTLSKFLDENTGFIDVAMDPAEPDTLYAAAYQVRRDGFSGGNPRDQYGPHAGLYKTTDGGKTWAKMAGGLPANQYGRCGLAIYRKDPNIIYAVVQTEKTNASVRGQTGGNDNDPSTGGIFRSADKGANWVKVNNLCPRPFYYGQIRIDPTDDQRIYVLGISFHVSSDGGKTFPGGAGGGGKGSGSGGGGLHPDHHALWINPLDSNHLVLGNDGGLYVSKSKGRTWEALRGMALGQFYAVGVDMRQPYRVYGGLQDNGSWGGPTATLSTEGITLADWRRVGGGDGFYCLVDPGDNDTLYVESQYGNLRRMSLSGSGQGRTIRPRPAKGDAAYRFNWNSPILMSPHDTKTIYYGGNHLFKSTNRGDQWAVISPDLTRGKPGPSEYSGHTITTIAESPLKAGVLYVGTDDGRLHVTRNGGATWTDLSDKVLGNLPDRWITRVECSHFAEGTAYLTIDRHRNDDLKTYLFKTTDFGATWTPLLGNLPREAPAHVIRESSKNKDLLFLGTENGLFTSLDGGTRWFHLKNGLPPAVPINDLVIHPRDRELVIGTHGRSVYVMDVAPLEELTANVLRNDAHLCAVKPAVAFKPTTPEKPSPSTAYKAPNPAYGAVIHYYLRAGTTEPVSISVANGSGSALMTLPGAQQSGLHQAIWDLRAEGANGTRVEPGEYTVTLKVGSQVLTQKLRVEPGK